MPTLTRLNWPSTLLLTLLVLLVLEFALRLWVISPAASKQATKAGWIDQPHHQVVFSREGYSRTKINSFGYHDREPMDLFTWRVLVMGDSYGEAFHVSRKHTFAQVAERSIPGLDIINTSRSGLTPLHYALYLEQHIQNWDPQAVVLIINDSEIDDLIAMNLAGNTQEVLAAFAERDRIALLGWTGWKAWVETLLRKSALITFMYHRSRLLVGKEQIRLRNKFFPHTLSGTDRQNTAVPGYLAGVYGSLYQTMQEAGVQLVYVYIPHIDYSSSGAVNSWPERRRFYRSFAEQSGALLVDLSEPFIQAFQETGQPAHGFHNSVIGSGHINRLGHEITGKVLAETLETILQ